uniref:Uncharacterized protein n=1 Tax=Setaria viridis TaxID=4556 RepID=A0A4U6T2K3_SETVI|nr:hypothetical protein SEVIR_9G066140v2 [Setaria viridis]
MPFLALTLSLLWQAPLCLWRHASRAQERISMCSHS